ncbi:hypothetical protein P43SY_009576 [Pythium insidiosum]|uniref:Uncharacterized protein n=1 Tax=Pythium insidiosum TaxID=114742 RepID=A0AAD5MCS3_PYTIN|nr:hypothetical protein P43SY_009576 [Pythium insidiosum]KAJ0406591.1 hypothetical protein ATCC90586_003102 [Pythium insidiosum]
MDGLTASSADATLWRVRIGNLIAADELEDDDEFADAAEDACKTAPATLEVMGFAEPDELQDPDEADEVQAEIEDFLGKLDGLKVVKLSADSGVVTLSFETQGAI